jgi:hypothetical protein
MAFLRLALPHRRHQQGRAIQELGSILVDAIAAVRGVAGMVCAECDPGCADPGTAG